MQGEGTRLRFKGRKSRGNAATDGTFAGSSEEKLSGTFSFPVHDQHRPKIAAAGWTKKPTRNSPFPQLVPEERRVFRVHEFVRIATDVVHVLAPSEGIISAMI
jgi:hypothetical protein